MAEALPNKNVVFYIKGSPPFISNPDFKTIYQTVLNDKSIKIVILTMKWYTRGVSEIPEESTLEAELGRTVRELVKAHKKVYLVEDIPNFPFDPVICKGKRRLDARTICEVPFSFMKEQGDRYLQAFNQVVQHNREVKLLYAHDYFCNPTHCSMKKNQTLFYRSSDHLN